MRSFTDFPVVSCSYRAITCPLGVVLLAAAGLSTVACDGGPLLAWSVVDSPDAAGSFHGIQGVTVCVDHHPEIDCAVTDASGAFELRDVPNHVELLLTLKKAG